MVSLKKKCTSEMNLLIKLIDDVNVYFTKDYLFKLEKMCPYDLGFFSFYLFFSLVLSGEKNQLVVSSTKQGSFSGKCIFKVIIMKLF